MIILSPKKKSLQRLVFPFIIILLIIVFSLYSLLLFFFFFLFNNCSCLLFSCFYSRYQIFKFSCLSEECYILQLWSVSFFFLLISQVTMTTMYFIIYLNTCNSIEKRDFFTMIFRDKDFLVCDFQYI